MTDPQAPASEGAHLEPPWLDRVAYPFARHDVQLPQGRMHYVDEGAGPVVLFAHGTPTWSFEFRHLIRALSSAHRCVAPDHLGFGLSERPEAFDYTPEAHAAVLRVFVERLELRDVTLVVHDFGGPIALPLAVARPGIVRRLAVINSWMWPIDDDPTVRRGARVAGSWFGKLLYRELALPLRVLMPQTYADRKRLTPEIHAQYKAPFASRGSRAQVLWPLARSLLGSRAHYAALEASAHALAEVPVAVIWGMRDTALGAMQLAHWRRLLPHAAVTEIADAGHWPHEEKPDGVVAALRELLRAPAP
jgi:haloalkane dehalogenase